MRIFQTSIDLNVIKTSFSPNQMAGFLGIQFTKITDDTLTAEMPISDRHARPGGIMNGGASLAFIETIASVAGSCCIDRTKQDVFGLEVNANHIRRAKVGETLTGTARAIHVGRSTHVWEVKIENASGQLVCLGRTTLYVASKPQMS